MTCTVLNGGLNIKAYSTDSMPKHLHQKAQLPIHIDRRLSQANNILYVWCTTAVSSPITGTDLAAATFLTGPPQG